MALLELEPDMGLTVSYEYQKTTLQETVEGLDYMNAQWIYPLGVYSFTNAVLPQYIYEYIRDFFTALKGSEGQFNFYDPIDYIATAEPFYTGFGVLGALVYSQGVVYEYNGEFQFAKKYNIGTFSLVRPINYPDTNTIQVFNGTTNVTSSLGFGANGTISSGGNSNLTWTGTFSLLCRFENDVLPIGIETFYKDIEQQLYSIPDLRIMEVKVESLKAPHNLTQTYNHYLSIPLELQTQIPLMTKTDIFISESGFESRASLNSIRSKFEFPELTVHKETKEYIIILLRLGLGTWSNFQIKDIEASVDSIFRFSEIPSFQTLLYAENGVVQMCKINNLKFIEENDFLKSTFCRCWIITRSDGFQLGFTNHDRQLTVSGLGCTPTIAFESTSTTKTAELNVDNIETKSITNDFYVDETDIRRGLYDEAKVDIYLYDWLSETIVSKVFTGDFGDYTLGYLPTGSRTYQFQTIGTSEKLNNAVSVKTTSICRHRFLSQGDSGKACNRVIDNNVRIVAVLTGVISPNVLQIGFGLDNWSGYKSGVLKFGNQNYSQRSFYIESASGLNVTIGEDLPYPPTIGSELTMTRHCDGSVAACRDYDNLPNYGAFPKLPGIDIVASNPTTGF
jgi:uncharacterized phage protein (TIGR02218 family)